MDSVQMLARQMNRMEGKLDRYLPMVLETKKIPAMEKKLEKIAEIESQVRRIDTVEEKADQGIKLKWQLVGGITVVSFFVQLVVAFIKST